MKKAFLLFTSIILLFNLCACATIKKDFEFSQKRANIQSIEIYDSKQTYTEADIHKFRENNKPIKVLVAQEQKDFLKVIEEFEFEKEVVLFPIPMDGGYYYAGYMIVIVYKDGSYDIIAEYGLYSYGSGDKHKYDHSNYCGKTPWDHIFEEYTKI